MTSMNSRVRRMLNIGLIGISVVLSGCVTSATNKPVRLYEGGKKPDSEVVKIFIPNALKLEKLDGKRIETPYVPGQEYQVHVLPGEHTVKVFYEEFWGDASSGGMYSSDVYDFKISALAGSSYLFQHDGPEDLVNADGSGSSAKSIKIWLKQLDTGHVTQAVSKTESGVLAGLFRQAGQEIKQGQVQPSAQAPVINAATDKTNKPAATPVLTRGDAASAALAEQDALARLKFWWKMADDKQRKEFQAWTWGSKANTK